VKNWKTKAHSKILWKIKRKTLTQIGSGSLCKNMANRKKSGSFRINCIVSIKSGKLKLCSFYVQYFLIKQNYILKNRKKKRRKNSDLKLVPVGGCLALLVLAHYNFEKKTFTPTFYTTTTTQTNVPVKNGKRSE
jgi:hypothetical protein